MTYNKAHIRRWIAFIDNYFVIFIIIIYICTTFLIRALLA
jgi:hypothetical protein